MTALAYARRMGMYGQLRRISPALYAHMKAHPASVVELVHYDEDAASPEIEAVADGLGADVNVEKMWQVLHFLVARNAMQPTPGAGQWILGGEECGEDAGYG